MAGDRCDANRIAPSQTLTFGVALLTWIFGCYAKRVQVCAFFFLGFIGCDSCPFFFLSWVYLVGKIGYLTGCSRGCFCQSIKIHKASGRSDSDANSEFGSNGETSHFLALLQADCVSGFFSALRV